MTADPLDGFVTVANAAVFVGCTEKTLLRRIHDGSLPGYRLGSRMLRVRIPEVIAAMQPVRPSDG